MTAAIQLHRPADLTERPAAGLAPRSIAEVATLAEMVAKSGLYGVKSREDALVRMMTGLELGLSAMQALRGVYVVNNRPTLAADLMVGVVKKRTDICKYFRLVESTDERATYETERVGEGVTAMTYTIHQARNAKLTGKDTWTGHAPAMLRARASSLLARAVYPDLLNGLYSPDEAEDAGPPQYGSMRAIIEEEQAAREVPAARPSPGPGDLHAMRAELQELATTLPKDRQDAAVKAMVTVGDDAPRLAKLLARVREEASDDYPHELRRIERELAALRPSLSKRAAAQLDKSARAAGDDPDALARVLDWGRAALAKEQAAAPADETSALAASYAHRMATADSFAALDEVVALVAHEETEGKLSRADLELLGDACHAATLRLGPTAPGVVSHDRSEQ